MGNRGCKFISLQDHLTWIVFKKIIIENLSPTLHAGEASRPRQLSTENKQAPR